MLRLKEQIKERVQKDEHDELIRNEWQTKLEESITKMISERGPSFQ